MAAFCCAGTPDRAAARRGRIIEAARKLFVDNGFHATGVAQIAKASGVAVGQIYRDFAAKEDIVAAIVEGDCRAFMARDSLRRAIAAGDHDAVHAWLRELFRLDDDGDEALFAEIVAESSRNPRIAAILAAMQAELRDNVLAALALLAPGDALDDRRGILADAIISQSLGLLHYRLLRPGVDAEALEEAIVAIVAREIAATAEPRRARDPV